MADEKNPADVTVETTTETTSTTTQASELEQQLEALKAETAKKDEQLKQAGYTIQQLKTASTKDKSTDDSKKSEQMLTAEDVQKMLQEDRQSLLAETQRLESQRIALELAAGDAEKAKEILNFHQNRMIPSGSDLADLTNDLRTAQAAVHGAELRETTEETKRTLHATQTTGTGAGGSYSKDRQPETQKVSPAAAKFLTAFGVKPGTDV